MACCDCEDCKYHESYDGKCTRYEYNCPFYAIRKYSIDDIAKFESIVSEMEIKLNELRKLDEQEYAIDDEIISIGHQLDNIKEKFDRDLIEEYKNIIST